MDIKIVESRLETVCSIVLDACGKIRKVRMKWQKFCIPLVVHGLRLILPVNEINWQYFSEK